MVTPRRGTHNVTAAPPLHGQCRTDACAFKQVWQYVSACRCGSRTPGWEGHIPMQGRLTQVPGDSMLTARPHPTASGPVCAHDVCQCITDTGTRANNLGSPHFIARHLLAATAQGSMLHAKASRSHAASGHCVHPRAPTPILAYCHTLQVEKSVAAMLVPPRDRAWLGSDVAVSELPHCSWRERKFSEAVQ